MAKYWINHNGHDQQGPFTIQELEQLELTPDTYVWTSGMARWQKIGTVPQLAHLLPQGAQEPTSPNAAPTPPPYAATAMPPLHGAASMGTPAAPQQVPPCPPTHLVWAIVTTVLCCWPLCIVAIVLGMKVKTCHLAGDYERAQRYSDNSAWCVILSIVLGMSLMPFALVSALL